MYPMILKFWFEEIGHSLWWAKNDEVDQRIRERFAGIHTKAIRCEFFDWRKDAEGRLAEIIVLDQFSRNMFRRLLYARMLVLNKHAAPSDR